MKYEFNIMNEKLDVFSKEIHELSQQEFSLINFEALITRIRNHVSEVNLQVLILIDFLRAWKISNEIKSIILLLSSLFGN